MWKSYLQRLFFTVFGHYVTVNHNILSALSVLYDKKR